MRYKNKILLFIFVIFLCSSIISDINTLETQEESVVLISIRDESRYSESLFFTVAIYENETEIYYNEFNKSLGYFISISLFINHTYRVMYGVPQWFEYGEIFVHDVDKQFYSFTYYGKFIDTIVYDEKPWDCLAFRYPLLQVVSIPLFLLGLPLLIVGFNRKDIKIFIIGFVLVFTLFIFWMDLTPRAWLWG